MSRLMTFISVPNVLCCFKGSVCSALIGDVVPSNVIVSAPSKNHFSRFQVNHTRPYCFSFLRHNAIKHARGNFKLGLYFAKYYQSQSDCILGTVFSPQEMGVAVTHSNQDVIHSSRLVFLAVKPHLIPTVLSSLSEHVTPQHVIVSVAAGVTIATLERVRDSVIAIYTHWPVSRNTCTSEHQSADHVAAVHCRSIQVKNFR